MKSRLKPLIALLAAAPLPLLAEDVPTLDAIVVTATRMSQPLTVVLDPRAPQQPAPANDGAAFLKTTPGFAVIRKGGTDGDPVLRGLAGSRLNILLDGADFHGGCGMRMDPPTAYVFPETFDKVTVIKGPQTVLHGNGNSAGVVLFEHDPKALERPGGGLDASLTAGGWGRLDALIGGRYASEKAYIKATATHAESDDYEDGDGGRVHSFYQRQSLSAMAGWTPDRDTRLEFSAVGSRAEAAYADRSMDGVEFDREGYGLRFEKQNLGEVLRRIKAQVNYNYIDHVMDNYSLRADPAGMCAGAPPMGPGCFMVNNPDRETRSARISGELAVTAETLLTLGADWQANEHALRKLSGPTAAGADAYASRPRVRDMETRIAGVFGELRHALSDRARWIAGLRLDDWSADRYNSTSGSFLADADAVLRSGFLRYERDLAQNPATLFVGVGHSQRPMDYWEASTYGGLTGDSALDAEKNTQLDAGIVWKRNGLSASVSLFYSRMDDYILTFHSDNGSPANALDDLRGAASIDATRWGGEADLAWRFAPAWTLRGSLAYVRGENDSRDVPLAQTPPLEGRLGLDYRTGAWTFGGVLRAVAEQDRVDPGYGNIVGQDYGRTPGFATLSVNAAYRPNRQWLVSAGIDNLLDRTYAEHLARDDSFEAGANTRVHEPGRFLWIKLHYTMD